MYKKNLFLVLIIYISSYIFNYIYTNKTLHFLDWYYLITILFIFLWNYVVDKKSKKNILILYGISTFLFFLIKILNNVQIFMSDINDFIKRINNWNSYLFTGSIVIYFIILSRTKIYKKNNQENKDSKKINDDLYENRKKDKEFILNFIMNNDNKNIYTLGIDSEYGTGKTFIVEKTIEEIEELDYKKFEVIKIRCMLLEKEEIYSYILKKIRKILSKNSIFTVSFEKLSNTFLKTIDNKFFGGISELLSQNIVIDEIDYFKEIIEKLDKTIILVFDDIDRVNDTEKIERILSFISDFSIKNIKILVLFNSQNLKNINEKYNRNYLEKYIPVTRKITNIPFIELLKKEITSNNLDEEDFKFLYIIEKKDIYIYPKEYQKMRDIFQFNYDFEILVKGEIEIGSLEFSPRMIKNFIEEVSNFLKLNSEWEIEKRLLIAYVFLKNLYYDEFYEKIENTSKSFVETFPIKLNFESENIDLTLEDLDLLKNIVKNKSNILSNENKYYGNYKDINDKRIFFDDNFFGNSHINYYLNKIGEKSNNLLIEEKLDIIEQFLKNNENYSIETENLLIYTLFNYPLYLDNKDYKAKERIDKIEKAIKKLTYLGNKEYLSAKEKFYRKFMESLKKENIEEIRNDFNKIFDEFYRDSNGNTPFYLGIPAGISAMEAIIILGTIEEQERFLDVILYNDKDKISNVYIEAFLKSNIKKSELSDKIIEYFLKDKIKISKDTLYRIIENMERFLFHFHIYNRNPLKKFYKEYLENLKIELEISKDNNSEIFKELNFIEKVYNKYFDFIDKLLEMLDDNKLNIENEGIKTSISTKIIEPIEKIKKSDDEKSKNEKLEELFNMGVINLQSIREAYKEVNTKIKK